MGEKALLGGQTEIEAREQKGKTDTRALMMAWSFLSQISRQRGLGASVLSEEGQG